MLENHEMVYLGASFFIGLMTFTGQMLEKKTLFHLSLGATGVTAIMGVATTLISDNPLYSMGGVFSTGLLALGWAIKRKPFDPKD